MNRIALFGLGVLAVIGVAETGNAAVLPGLPVTTGPQSFVIEPFESADFSRETNRLGGQTTGPILFDVGSVPIVALLGFAGDTFKVKYEVEGVGALVFSDKITVKVSATLGADPLGAPQTFDVLLSGSCGDATETGILNDCRDTKLLTAFASSQPVVLPAGVSGVTFSYDVLQSDELCTATTKVDGSTFVGACLSGGTTIVDTSDLFDPHWSASLTVAEPATLTLVVFSLASSALLRRRQRRA